MEKFKKLNEDELSKVIGGSAEEWMDPTVSFISIDYNYGREARKIFRKLFGKHSRKHRK